MSPVARRGNFLRKTAAGGAMVGVGGEGQGGKWTEVQQRGRICFDEVRVGSRHSGDDVSVEHRYSEWGILVSRWLIHPIWGNCCTGAMSRGVLRMGRGLESGGYI